MAMRAATVPTITVQIVNYEERRKSLVVMNNGVNRIFISNDPQDLQAGGFPLDPGVAVEFSEEGGDEPALRLFAIANTAPVEVRIVEGYPP